MANGKRGSGGCAVGKPPTPCLMHLLVLAAADGLPNQDVVGTAPRDAVDCRQVVPAVSGATDERKGKLRFNG